MNSFEQKSAQNIEIENIKNPEGNEVSYSPERGGIVTSVKFQGKEILYLDSETLNNTETNVKGGVPILFPNAGPIPDELKTNELKNLKQHGFARNLKFTGEKTVNGFKEILISNEETKKVYSYDFKLTVEGSFDKDNSFTLIQKTENLEKEKELPISSGLHPYFKVPSNEKKNIQFNFEGGKYIKEQIENWANGKFCSIVNPGVPIEIYIPELGTLIFEISKEYERVWIWSQEGKDFICVEPVMREQGGIVSDPKNIKPGEKFELSFKISMKE